MPLSLSTRVAIVATSLLVGSGASPGPAWRPPLRAGQMSAPKLIAHDVTGFAGHKSRAPVTLGPQIYNDSVASDSDANVLNPSGDIGRTQYVFRSRTASTSSSRAWASLLAEANSAASGRASRGRTPPGSARPIPQGEPSVTYDQPADRWVVAEAAYAGGAAPGRALRRVRGGLDHLGRDRSLEPLRLLRLEDVLPQPADPGRLVGRLLPFVQPAHRERHVGRSGRVGARALQDAHRPAGAGAVLRRCRASRRASAGCCRPASTGRIARPRPCRPDHRLHEPARALSPGTRRSAQQQPIVSRSGNSSSTGALPDTSSTFTPQISLLTNGPDGFNVDTEFCCGGLRRLRWPAWFRRPRAALEPLAQAYYGQAAQPAYVRHCLRALPQLGGRLQWNRTPVAYQTLTAVETVNGGKQHRRPRLVQADQGRPQRQLQHGAQGIYDVGDGNSRFLPSVALDEDGNVGLAYALTGAASRATRRLATPRRTTRRGSTTHRRTALRVHRSATRGVATRRSRSTRSTVARSGSKGRIQDSSHVARLAPRIHVPGLRCRSPGPPLLTSDPTWSAPLVREGLNITGDHATLHGDRPTTYTYQWRAVRLDRDQLREHRATAGRSHRRLTTRSTRRPLPRRSAIGRSAIRRRPPTTRTARRPRL